MTTPTLNNVEEPTPQELKEVPAPRKITEREIRKLRRLYITVVHGKVRACGHGFNPNTTPSHYNCLDCWEAYFMMSTDTAAIHDDFMKGGKQALINAYGAKFVRHFNIFLNNQMMKYEQDSRNVENPGMESLQPSEEQMPKSE
jgi:hypothetical protein